MSTFAERLVTECRRFLGVPFAHQGRLPSVGLDCAGLIIAGARAAGRELVDDTAYTKRPDTNVLIRCIRQNGMKPVSLSALQPGDLAVFKFDSNPQHVALVTLVDGGGAKIIHAAATNRKVVEHYLSATWRAKLCHAWRFPPDEET